MILDLEIQEEGEWFYYFASHIDQITGEVVYDDPVNRVAFEKNETGYCIFADVPNFLINIFIQLWFVENGISMVHAAAVADESGRVIIFPGPGGVGKTAILAYMAKERGFHLLGDDIVFADVPFNVDIF